MYWMVIDGHAYLIIKEFEIYSSFLIKKFSLTKWFIEAGAFVSASK